VNIYALNGEPLLQESETTKPAFAIRVGDNHCAQIDSQIRQSLKRNNVAGVICRTDVQLPVRVIV